MKQKVYEVKIRVTKELTNGIKYRPMTITGLVFATNPTESAQAAKSLIKKQFNEAHKLQITKNKPIRHQYRIIAKEFLKNKS